MAVIIFDALGNPTVANAPSGTSTVFGGLNNTNSPNVAGKNSSQMPSVSGTGTTAKLFPFPGNSALACVIPVPGEGILEGRRFVINASGFVTVAGVSPTIDFVFYTGTSTTLASDTLIATFPASPQSVTTNASYPFAAQLIAQGDSVSGQLQFTTSVLLNGTATAATAQTSLTSINFQAASPILNIAFGVIFGVSNAANYGQLDQYELET